MYVEEAKEAGRILAKVAASVQEDPNRDLKDVAMGSAGLGGAYLAAAPAKERITGRKILYHGTTPEQASKIRMEGLRPAADTGVFGVTEAVLGKGVAKKPLVYTHPSKAQAKFYQEQQKAIEKGPDAFIRFRQEVMTDPFRIHRADTKGVVRMEIPHGKAKFVPNPETAGGLGEALGKGIDPATYYDLAHRTKTIEGGVSPEHVVGGRGFKKLTLREVGDYAKAHPGRFAGGAVLGAAGLGAALYGGKKLYDVARRHMGKEEQKTASNWQDFVTPEEKAQYDSAVGSSRAKAIPAVLGGAALGTGAGALAQHLGVPGGHPVVGSLLGAAAGLHANKKLFSKDDLSTARKIMMKGGRARGQARFEARLAREAKRQGAG